MRDTESVGDSIRQWPDLPVSAKNLNGMKALAAAAKSGHKDVVELLPKLPMLPDRPAQLSTRVLMR
jgi:hypothetical protein